MTADTLALEIDATLVEAARVKDPSISKRQEVASTQLTTPGPDGIRAAPSNR